MRTFVDMCQLSKQNLYKGREVMKLLKNILFLLFLLTNWAYAQQASIAVLPFTIEPDIRERLEINGKKSGLSVEKFYEVSLLTDKFLNQLVNSRKFKVVERSRMKEIMAEYDLSQASNLVDLEHAISRGQLLVADYLVSGIVRDASHQVTYTKIPYVDRFNRDSVSKLAVDIRIIDTRTGEVVAAKSDIASNSSRSAVKQRGRGGNIAMSPAELNQLSKNLSDRLVQQVIDAVYPIKIIANKQGVIFINRGEDQNIKVGEILSVYRSGERLIDPDTGVDLGATEAKIGTVKITALLEKFSKAVANTGSSNFQKGDICRKETSSAPKVKAKKTKSRVKPKW